MITVMFSCKGCGLEKHKLQVPARDRTDVDVTAWVNQTMSHVADEHRRLSPNCKETKCDLYLPMQDAEFLGQQVE